MLESRSYASLRNACDFFVCIPYPFVPSPVRISTPFEVMGGNKRRSSDSRKSAEPEGSAPMLILISAHKIEVTSYDRPSSHQHQQQVLTLKIEFIPFSSSNVGSEILVMILSSRIESMFEKTAVAADRDPCRRSALRICKATNLCRDQKIRSGKVV